jgi:hypothetical protein
VGKDGEVQEVSAEVVILYGAFTALVLLPFLPGAIELRRPRDDEALSISQDNAREPRHFGKALRRMLARFMTADEALPATREIQLRRPERLEIVSELAVPDGARRAGILVSKGPTVIGRSARVQECYAMGRAVLQEEATVRGLASDAQVTMGKRCVVERWVDAEGGISVGRDCDLGVSVSSGGRLIVGKGCSFRRLWGLPVVTEHGQDEPDEARREDSTLPDGVVWSRASLVLPPDLELDGDLVVTVTSTSVREP